MRPARFILMRLSRVTAYVGLIAWACASLYMLWVGNADIFQRLGALGVAAAVLFFSDQLAQIELSRQRTVEKLLHEFGLELAALRDGVPPTELPKTGYVIDTLTEERNFDALRTQASVFNALNVLLLTLATIQWGFGDRIVNRLITCGAVEC
ncbi:MAG: hypothetical protein AAFY38_02910 [Pseudomonadota bacterium]